MAMVVPYRMSVEEFFDLPRKDKRVHELIDGELVVTPTPSYRHEVVFGELFVFLRSLVSTRPDLMLLGPHSALRFGHLTLLSPDLFIHRRIPGNPFPHWLAVPLPLLVVEILSPSTASRDRGIKRHYYQRGGVEEYWIVNLKARMIERWHPEDEAPELVTGRLAFTLSVGLSGEFDVAEFFAEMERWASADF